MRLILVLGGARAGKSAYAQRQAEIAAGATPPIMIATAEARDAEMAARIARHQTERGSRWVTREVPIDLPQAIAGLQRADVAVVDCLTLWLNNLIEQERDTTAAIKELVRAFSQCPAAVWAISNEVGLGIVPDNPLARRYRDDIGRLHQDLAQIAMNVVLVVAGLPLKVK
jgi:adenosylcobinamide kinase/adenosylcobinamide-phosphate guanylyltransferase